LELLRKGDGNERQRQVAHEHVLLHQGNAVLAESDAPPELQCGQTPGQ
jgi:hypothetical protein